MKKYITISLFIFLVITVGVIVAGLISYDNNKTIISPNIINTNGINQSNNISGAGGAVPNINTLLLSSTELAKHNSSKSCWLLISGKIYDVTVFLNQHPGNASTILPTCGTDATAEYVNRGGTGTHSSSASSLLSVYFIGNLNQKVNTSPNNPTTPPVVNPNPTLPSSRGDDDYD